MSITDSTVSVVHNPARRRRNSKEYDHPNMRIILLGKDVSTNSRVGNFMLGRSAFDSEAPPDDHQIERVRGKDLMIINCPHLLQLNLSYHQIIQTVRECVDLSHPGPHLILLIFKPDECSREEQQRLEIILNYFSDSVYEHTLVITTHNSHSDHQTEVNDNIQKIIEKSINRHYRLKKNCTAPRLIETFRDILKSNDGRYLICDVYEDAQSFIGKQQTDERDPPEMRDDVRIVLLGKTGVGKSATGNTILNRQAFISDESFESVTSECQKQTAEINNRLITVIDTPGLFDSERSHEEIKREMMNCISMILPGPHVFLLLVPLGRFTQEESTSVKIIQEMFGENSLMYTMVLFTRGDQLRNKTIEECLGKPGSGIRNLLEECGNRYHVFNNNLTEDQPQVSLLLEKIDEMVKANGGSYYSSKIFREMEREKHEQQMKKLMERIEELSREKDEEKERMKMMMEEKQQSHEREKQKIEEEFREIKERHKIEIKAKEEQERQMRDEMRREREEHERHKREDNEKMREREKEMWGEYNQRLKGEREEMQRENEKIKQEKEKIEREKEDLQLKHKGEMKRLTKQTEEEKLNQDKEKKKREEEFRQREEEYKKEIKEKDEHVREMRDEMGRERETLKNEIEEVKKENKDLLMKYETQTDKLMNTIENHERERKRREDEFREKEERYNREIQEKEEQERQIRKEREEHERQSQDERQRTEEDEKEKQIYVEQCERLKSEMNEIMKEKERIKREKEDLQLKNEDEIKRLTKHIEEEKLNQDKEKKKREEEFRQREEEYKTEIKAKDEHVREMRDEMRREREEHERRKQEERQRREDDEIEKQVYVEQCERLKSEMNEIMKERIEREKERIEREKENQREEFEKRIQDERNMIEEKEKRYEDKLKLMKEENEEELKRRTTEMMEEYEREKEEMKKKISQSLHTSVQDFETAGVRPDEHLHQDKTEQIQHLFQKLHLTDKHQNKLRASDVLQISAHSLQSHESCEEEELVKIYLQKLLMMNYRARYITTKDTNEQHHTQQTDDDLLEEEDIFEEMSLSNYICKSDPVHPMDVQMSVFHCADSFLKQLMVTKLSQCQFALPLLVPHPFTQQIEFPLWTFRQINKSWKMINTNNEIISKEEPVYKAKTPMVSFFRFGSVSSSKSQLMNNLINEKHNTFFHRNCPGSSRTRLLMDGVVEIAWFCPSGKDTDKFTDCVAFCNLHGDTGVNEKQLQILTQMSSVNVVLLSQLNKNDKNATKIQNLYRDKKPLICLFTEDESAVTKMKKGKYKIGLKDRNQSEVSEELRKIINVCLSYSASASMFRLKDLSKHSDIRVDEEDDEDCRRGREAAQQMMSLLENKDLTKIKETFLPHQGKLWHLWCQKNKQLHRPQGDEIEQEISITLTEMKKIREQQQKSHISDFVKFFTTQMNLNDKRLFFLKWLRIFLNDLTSADLSALHHIYNDKWSTFLKLKYKNKSEQLKAEQTELERISKDLQAANFGLEHIMREIGQIYESCSSMKKIKTDLQFNFLSLPSLAAEMMICGFPLELMDGDAAHVPLIWITAVLDKLIQKLGDQRVFVLSVLGLQSSGKSTMLNAMFGLQFAVSAGRCTTGAFMQLIRVSEEMKQHLKFNYILVVDTEGLRALELAGRSTRHHDNELATFVVGLGNLTLINIFGENPAEMQDILQIVVRAFLRMKIKLNPSCMFVHHNVSDVTAGDKNIEGRRRLQEILDEMTKLAAKEEDSDAECFNNVINFNVENDVKYFPQLWEGSPPMAPPNPNYCENIQELKKTIISQASKSDGMKLTHLRERIKDLWESLLNERFVFSFKNSLEISAYRRLETEYSKWTWTLRSAMMNIENKLQNKIENESIHEIEERDLQRELKEKSEEVKKSMSDFFEKDTDRDILNQWKTSFEIKIIELKESIVRETKRKLNVILQQRDLKRKIDAQRTQHENTLLEKSKELALKLKDKTNDEEMLKREFDVFWEEFMKKITTDSPPIKDIDIMRDVKILLTDIYKSVSVDTWKESRDISTVQSYSDYVWLKKSRGINAYFKNAFKLAQEKLSTEDETQIRNFITDVSEETIKMIQSFNISKMGYNKSYIQQLTGYIKAKITDYEMSENCVIKKEFFIDLVFSIFKRTEKTFNDQHRMFIEVNDPVLYLKKKRDEYYSIFQKYCQGATSAAIFGKIICQKLKEPIEQRVYKHTARDLADKVKSNCPSLNENRSKIETHILKRLAEEENFDKYMNYIHNPKDHFKSFIRDEVHQYIRDQFSISVQPKMNQNIEVLQQKILTAAHESTEDVQVKSGDVDLWLMFFTQKLSDVLIFSVKDFSGVNHDDVDDFKLLEDVIRKELQSIISDISREFNTDTFNKKLNLDNRPDEILIDYFCQCCWVQCPFCKATCTNTIEEHDGDHSVPFHRVTGVNGFYIEDSQTLCTDFCSAVVRSSKRFKLSDLWNPFNKYRRAGGVYAKWSITPDLSELPYWKWFVCRFQKELEIYYKKTFQGSGENTSEWRKYTKHEAIESLDKFI